jgi:hypothetical protein
MNITIENIKDNEDGSANCEVYLDQEARDVLIRKALIDCLYDLVEKGKEFTVKETE